ncbi:MAG: hypothetical protein NTX50_27500 [Candidatus Sumerlaeota bacterium]|nr:hypothetical protein [Candidatus Sumerlaeota bacterium]
MKIIFITYFRRLKAYQIDGIVLDVLIRKHQSIRHSLGISVAVPMDSYQAIKAIFEGILLRKGGASAASMQQLDLLQEDKAFQLEKSKLHDLWEDASAREKRSRSLFAQETIKVEEVARELESARDAIGAGVDVERFVISALRAHGAVIGGTDPISVDLANAPSSLRDMLQNRPAFKARFDLPVPDGVIHLNRTHPIVEGLASYVMNSALDPQAEGIAARCGVITTREVAERTTLLLIRFRFQIITTIANQEHPLLAEDCQAFAFTGAPTEPRWLDAAATEQLLGAAPAANTNPDLARHFLRQLMDNFSPLRPHLEKAAHTRAAELLDAHRRVRQAAQRRHVKYDIEPKLPPDALAIYIYLPAKGA